MLLRQPQLLLRQPLLLLPWRLLKRSCQPAPPFTEASAQAHSKSSKAQSAKEPLQTRERRVQQTQGAAHPKDAHRAQGAKDAQQAHDEEHPKGAEDHAVRFALGSFLTMSLMLTCAIFRFNIDWNCIGIDSAQPLDDDDDGGGGGAAFVFQTQLRTISPEHAALT